MNVARHQFLAGARFADDENGGLARRDPVEIAPQRQRGGILEHHRGRPDRVLTPAPGVGVERHDTNGNSVAEIKKQIDDIRTKAARNGHSVKIGVNAFAIARPSEAEARQVLAEILENTDPEAVRAFHHEVQNAGNASPEREGNWAKSTLEDLVQYNDGFKTNLIGAPEQIAERILALKEVGVDLVLLGFLHFQEEVEFFGKHVVPLVRKLEAAQEQAKRA
jgi:FMNH2-dependent dimethyl sulfone monooxygenase